MLWLRETFNNCTSSSSLQFEMFVRAFKQMLSWCLLLCCPPPTPVIAAAPPFLPHSALTGQMASLQEAIEAPCTCARWNNYTNANGNNARISRIATVWRRLRTWNTHAGARLDKCLHATCATAGILERARSVPTQARRKCVYLIADASSE